MLSETELAKLELVHPDLAVLVEQAAYDLPGTFVLFEGARSIRTQRAYVARGVSRTMASKHIVQSDGYAYAVDLVPLYRSLPRWEWDLIYPIARKMRELAKLAQVPITWGGVWDRLLTETADNLRDEVIAYCQRHPGPDFLDGPHYELAAKP